MRNDVDHATAPDPDGSDAPAAPLVILGADEDLVCVDDLCVPAEAVAPSETQPS